MTSIDIKEMTIELFKQRSDRDKQHKVGASNISNPCTKHLAHDLLGTPEPEQKYWMGAKIGTAIHSFLEAAIEVSDSPVLKDAIVEQKITLGEIAGYGVVSSKPDLVLPSAKHLVDWKTSSRAKIKKLQNLVDGLNKKPDPDSEHTLTKYIGQGCLYAWGLAKQGIEIQDISLVFVNRDGTNENDVWVYSFKYDEDIACALWNRVVYLWSELEAGVHPDSYAASEHCFKCAVGI
jgi:hypothetical protein